MRRLLVLLVVILWLPGMAGAGIEPGNSIVLVNAGYMSGNLAATGQTADGNVASVGFEHVGTPGRTTGFISIGYGKISDDESDSTGILTRSVETIPIYVGVKGYFGKGNFQFHVGGAFGVYFTSITSSVNPSGEEWNSWSTTGYGMGFPIGLTVCLGETLFINGEYVLNWTWSNDALESNILNAVVLGLGFRWGKAVTGG